LNAKDWVKQSYAGGVAYGRRSAAMPAGGKGTAPSFVVWAVKDPTSGNLDRIQIIKGLDQERPELREDLRRLLGRATARPTNGRAGFQPIQSTVDLEKSNLHELRRLDGTQERYGRIPSFDPSLHAFYLRPRARDPDAPLDPHPGRQVRGCRRPTWCR